MADVRVQTKKISFLGEHFSVDLFPVGFPGYLGAYSPVRLLAKMELLQNWILTLLVNVCNLRTGSPTRVCANGVSACAKVVCARKYETNKLRAHILA